MSGWIVCPNHGMRVGDLSLVVDFTDYRRRWWQWREEPAIRYELIDQVTRRRYHTVPIGWWRYRWIQLGEMTWPQS